MTARTADLARRARPAARHGAGRSGAHRPDAVDCLAFWRRLDVDSRSRARSTADRRGAERKLNDRAARAGSTLQEAGDHDEHASTWASSPVGRVEPRRSCRCRRRLIGSLYMMLIVLVLALPIGVAASIYLEEFAPKNRLTDLIEVNINNLAAVPSIVFGLLGLAVFINFMRLPRSAPIVGGLVLTLMTLPTIIIATRAALKAVPPSIRERRSALGASQDADGLPPCAAAGHARHPDRHDHRPGPRARRNRAAAADRHGRLRRRLSRRRRSTRRPPCRCRSTCGRTRQSAPSSSAPPARSSSCSSS